MEDQNIDMALGMLEEEKDKNDKNITRNADELAGFLIQYGIDKDNRRNIDWQWFVYDNFVRGNHFVKWNKDTSTIESVASKNVMRFPINKIYSTLRAVRGFVTKYDPKWDVYPANRSDKATDEARYKQRLLDETWTQDGLKAISKSKVYDGLKFSIGIVELGWDKEEQKVTFDQISPFDIFFGGGQGSKSRRVTKAVKKNIDELKNDPKYKGYKGEILPESDEAAAEVKQQIDQINNGYQNKSEDDNTCILRETFYLTDKKNSLGGKVNIASYTGSSFLRHIETPYDSLWDVFKVYKSDVNPGETYGEGWVKHLIPPQKMIDILESQTMEYHHMFAKGRYVVPKNSGAKLITSENGIILEHNPGKRPQVENAPSMTASVEQQIQRFNVYLEDIGGAHDATLGRIPTGATAGVAIEALQEGDANNLRDLTENFDIDLVETAKGIFKMYAKNLKTTKIIETDDVDKDGLPNHFAIIGEDAKNIPETITQDGEEIPVCVIRKEEKVRVTVGSWLAYNREALEARVYKHYTAGLIDRRTALDALKYSDPDGIIARAVKEEVLKTMTSEGPPMPGEPQQPQGPVPGEGPAMEMNTADAGIPTPPLPQMMQ
jgi:hypothetical protein